MELILIRAVSWFCSILQMLLVVTAILSWFAGASETVRGLYQMGTQLTAPLVDPIRRFINRGGDSRMMIDFSPLIAFFLIEIVQKILIRIILMIF